jgi:IclR family pca regulon transcriptional regulator
MQSMKLGADKNGKSLKKKPNYELQTLEKAIAILSCFSTKAPFLSISDISIMLGQHRSSVRRSISTFTKLGYLQENNKKFSLGPKVLDFGYQYLSALPFWGVAQPVIEELSDQINETVSIGLLDRSDVVFILRVPSKRLLNFDPSIGSRVPAHLHSLGHVLLANLTNDEQEKIINSINFKSITKFSIKDKTSLLKEIELTRRQGWSFTSRQYEEQYCGISVPIFSKDNQNIAALNVSFVIGSDANRRAVEDILPLLKLGARKINESL